MKNDCVCFNLCWTNTDCHLIPYEKAILAEIVTAIANSDSEQVNYFAGFGNSFRAIMMNLNEHRRALEFGFTDIAFTKYGWFASPKCLDRKDIKLEQSEIRIRHGPNGIWAYALSCNYVRLALAPAFGVL